MKDFTIEQKEEYLQRLGGWCPFCTSPEVYSYCYSLDFENGKTYNYIECSDCGESWVEEYVLSNITREKEL
jgi:formate dehydrogenase maturation protein FdhE